MPIATGKSVPRSSDLDIQRMVGASFLHPIVTDQVRAVCQDDRLRVEHNQVRNLAVGQQGLAMRVMPIDDSHYESVIIPVLVDGRLLLLGRYRYAIGRWSIELPRSHRRSDETGWKHAAEKQLLDDAGLEAAKMTLLGAMLPDPSLESTSAVVVLAEECVERRAMSADPRELVAGSVALSHDELDQLVRRGEITCGVTLAALYVYHAQSRR